MSNRTTLAQLRKLDAKGASVLPTDHLMLLLEDVAAQQADTKALDDKLRTAMVLRFGDAAAEMRRAKGTDTGTVSLEEGEFIVKADLPKTVKWDQAALTRAMDEVVRWGEKPSEYVDAKLSVKEAKYNNWPTSIRTLFEPARTVATGSPKFSIERRSA